MHVKLDIIISTTKKKYIYFISSLLLFSKPTIALCSYIHPVLVCIPHQCIAISWNEGEKKSPVLRKARKLNPFDKSYPNFVAIHNTICVGIALAFVALTGTCAKFDPLPPLMLLLRFRVYIALTMQCSYIRHISRARSFSFFFGPVCKTFGPFACLPVGSNSHW